MGPEEAVELQSQTACPITEKTLLVAAPEDLVAEPGVLTGLSVFGDDILFTFDPFDAPDREYGHFNRCSGALERYPAFVPGLHHPRMITTDQGRVVYANDDQARAVLVDRFDVPGADEPQPVPGLPETAELGFFYSTDRFAQFIDWTDWWDGSIDCYRAAGLGCSRYAYYTHTGGAAPVIALSTQAISRFHHDEEHLLFHDDDGTVRIVDAMTGDDEILHTGVRYIANNYDRKYFIWQAIVDDQVEPVYRHDFATGEDLQIAVNDFAAQSWRSSDRDVGEWLFTEPGTAAAMLGPGEVFVTAVDLKTGEPLAIPPSLATGALVRSRATRYCSTS